MFSTRPAMTRQEQVSFVRAICSRIAGEIIGRIEINDIPESWDGRQLRIFLSEEANRICDPRRYMLHSDMEAYYRDKANYGL